MNIVKLCQSAFSDTSRTSYRLLLFVFSVVLITVATIFSISMNHKLCARVREHASTNTDSLVLCTISERERDAHEYTRTQNRFGLDAGCTCDRTQQQTCPAGIRNFADKKNSFAVQDRICRWVFTDQYAGNDAKVCAYVRKHTKSKTAALRPIFQTITIGMCWLRGRFFVVVFFCWYQHIFKLVCIPTDPTDCS